METIHDTIITISLPGIGTAGNIVARRGDLAQVIAFQNIGRAAIEQAIDCAVVALEAVQLNPPPVFAEVEPEVKPAAAKPVAAKKTTKKVEKPKLEALPTTAPAPRITAVKTVPALETAAAAPKPDLQQLSLF